MEEFLESSTVHGVSYISSARNIPTKLFWISIVIMGFSTAGYLINNAFLDWEKSPIDTSIETFPKIVVCPPKVEFRLIPMT